MLERRKSHPFFMYDSIMSTTQIIRDCLEKDSLDKLKLISTEIHDRKINRIYFTGSGTSYHAGIAASHFFNNLLKLPTYAILASEFHDYPVSGIDRKSAIIVISHTGRTEASVKAARVAKKMSAYVIGLTEVKNSPITKFSDDISLGPGGEELAYPKTRSYVAALLRSYLLGIMLGERLGVSKKLLEALLTELNQIPKIIDKTLKSVEGYIIDLAEKFKEKNIFYVLGSGPSFATAQEAALKLMEASCVNAFAFEFQKFAHGPFIVCDESTVLVFVTPPGKSYEEAIAHLKAQRFIGSKTISVAREGDQEVCKNSDEVIEIPENVDETITPIPYILPIYLLSYYMAVEKNLNPDIFKMDEPRYLKAFKEILPSEHPPGV